jgi:hypothetical protein
MRISRKAKTSRRSRRHRTWSGGSVDLRHAVATTTAAAANEIERLRLWLVASIPVTADRRASSASRSDRATPYPAERRRSTRRCAFVRRRGSSRRNWSHRACRRHDPSYAAGRRNVGVPAASPAHVHPRRRCAHAWTGPGRLADRRSTTRPQSCQLLRLPP